MSYDLKTSEQRELLRMKIFLDWFLTTTCDFSSDGCVLGLSWTENLQRFLCATSDMRVGMVILGYYLIVQ